MLIRIVDTETCGLPPDNAQCVELGWCDIVGGEGEPWEVQAPHSMLVNPGVPIPAIASAVHHIVDEDVKDAPSLAHAMAQMNTQRDHITARAFVAHRASFEQTVLAGMLDKTVEWICSWKVAVTLAPNAPSYSNQALRYWLKLEVDRERASPPHRAAPDAYVTAHLIKRALSKMTIEQMVEVSAGPILLPRWSFGKFTGEPFDKADNGYLEWVLKNVTDDENVTHSARTLLDVRRSAQRQRSPV